MLVLLWLAEQPQSRVEPVVAVVVVLPVMPVQPVEPVWLPAAAVLVVVHHSTGLIQEPVEPVEAGTQR
jgi:hypothetical protein